MKAKKSLGQNFFINKNLGEKIISYIPDNKTVVEIGPGQGFFTDLLKKKNNPLIVIEKDKELALGLKSIYPDLNIFEDDFLSFDLNKLPSKDIVFYGSLPYNVSKPIIKKIIESSYFTNAAYFIIQKEVAEKYIYREPYNILSLTTAIYAHVKKLFDIKPDSFRPKPKVTSSLIVIEPLKRSFQDENLLKDLIMQSFKQPRKNLKNNLKNTPFESLINTNSLKRPSDLSLEEYVQILGK